MKISKILLGIAVLACAINAQAQFPYHTNSASFAIATDGSSDFSAFDWKWVGSDDQAFDLNFDYAITNGTFSMRMDTQKRATNYTTISDFTISVTNATKIWSYTNMPASQTYFAEFILINTNTTPQKQRSLARGMITIMYSLWEN